uniref:Gldg family protein n=1 Tax=Ralstonia sp. RL TaxID=1839756 RepID=UPI00257B7081
QKKLLPSGTPVYFGLVGLMWDREFVIPAFDPDRAGQLEYDLTQHILHINNESPRRIGILGSRSIEDRLTSRFSGVMSELRRSYDVSVLPPDGKDIPQDISVLLALWTNEDKQANETYSLQQAKIERYLQQGGKLLMIIDPRLNGVVTPTTLDKPSPITEANFPFTSLFKHWGVQFNTTHVVGDLKNASSVQIPGLGSIRYPFLINISADGLSRNLPITKTLEKMVFLNSGALEQTTPPQRKGFSEFVPLIMSSSESGSYDFSTAPLLQLQKSSNRPESILSPLNLFSHGANPLANDLGPHFSIEKSTSDNVGAIEHIDQKLRSDQQPRILAGLVNQGSGSAPKTPTAIIVADADFIADDLAIFSPVPPDAPANSGNDVLLPDNAMALTKTSFQANEDMSKFGNASVQQPNDNINFVLNAIDYLSLNDSLAGIRSRGQSLREFTRVRDLEKVAQEQFLDAEKRSQAKLNAVTQKLNQTIRKKEGGQKFLMTAKQQSEIKKYLDEESDSKRELRAARSLLRENIKSLGNRLLLLNLLPVPLLVAFCGSFYMWRRSRRASV